MAIPRKECKNEVCSGAGVYDSELKKACEKSCNRKPRPSGNFCDWLENHQQLFSYLDFFQKYGTVPTCAPYPVEHYMRQLPEVKLYQDQVTIFQEQQKTNAQIAEQAQATRLKTFGKIAIIAGVAGGVSIGVALIIKWINKSDKKDGSS